MTGEEPCANVGGGLIVANNETIRSFLHSASQNPQLSQSLCESASNLSHENSIPYKTLRDIWSASPSFSRPKLRLLFSASDFVFSSPKPREKSEELKERLRKLAELAEKNEYEELVKDIKPRKGNDEPFSSYKDQLGSACCADDVYWLFGWICCIQSFVQSQRCHECCRRHLRTGVCHAP
ncbi:uncharacterized protein LOC131232699 isoform X2 [Magnolia sinica]|uniref:uncharacterized protein LOC131232699 isoform X2 n=1 Tax=Magnolia sinica TaxID=86752 RepID=UPI00265A4961|nr:uncharacterized protein LOC131232699 isoform X2 [Magnolia sinica]